MADFDNYGLPEIPNTTRMGNIYKCIRANFDKVLIEMSERDLKVGTPMLLLTDNAGLSPHLWIYIPILGYWGR